MCTVYGKVILSMNRSTGLVYMGRFGKICHKFIDTYMRFVSGATRSSIRTDANGV